ncbi:ABC transporter substrate-binding protein [Cellulomonas humilata]|uniref:ABC-type glycerol-3-phosphate transport system substrate-binding protein n=1 Tax=Cellulomonas humilata TaxID=144055 RepID=A0ABU0ED52_9CELL|nr:extracellular solute-binding protein [Cellulomonas humilata]MDQ0373198.1 ABC-type glycerol-3-phosphate transport system substrate-binding protein [Cellulomonas humilata]
MRSSRTTALAMAGVLSLGLLAACSNDDEPTGGESDGKITLTVAGLQPGAETEAVDALNARVEEFEAANPDINVEPEEYNWLASTFSAQLAGGTLPNVFEIPLTDAKTLIENGQLADISTQFDSLSFADDFNENLLEAGTGSDGKVYAIPAKSIYGVALHYNRNLFEQAGLDPDQPPTTWDEVREYAKTIHDATGVAGYATMALDNAGGWQLAAAANSRGGVIQEQDGDAYVATLDDPAVKEHLQWLHDLRFTDNSILPRTDLGWGEINEAFAGGQLAMYTSGSDVYNALVENNGLTEDWGYGLTAIPTTNGGGALTGGTLAAVTKESTDAQKDAAVKWIDFWYLSKMLDQDQAVADAKLRNENGQAVGTPVLPIFSEEQYATSLEWVKDYVNVPLDNMKGYTDVMFTQPSIGEISASTQDTYALLFPVVQAVLTDENADIDALLETANTQGQALLDQ